MKVKTAGAMLAPMVLVLATACSSQPAAFDTDYTYGAVTLQEAEAGLQRAQAWEAYTRDRRAKAAEAFKQKKEEYQMAGDRDKPAQLTLLASAQAAYLEAQGDHIEAKRQLDNARRVYVRKQIVTARPWLAAPPPPSMMDRFRDTFIMPSETPSTLEGAEVMESGDR